MLNLAKTQKVARRQILARVANPVTVPILAKAGKVANLARVVKVASPAKVGKAAIVDLEVNSHIRGAVKSQEEQKKVCLTVFNIAGESFKAFRGCSVYHFCKI